MAADRTLSVEAVPTAIYFSADGKTITGRCRDNHVRTWDVATGKLLSDKSVERRGALVAQDLYAELDGEKRTLKIWDLSADRQFQLVNGVRVENAAVSKDRKQIAVSSAADAQVQIYDSASGAKKHLLADGIGGAVQLEFSPDGETLVSANYDNDVRIWKTKSGELVRKLEELTGAMFAVEFTPDGKRLIMAGLDETVYIWDAKSYTLLKTMKGHGETIAAMAISPDGKTLVTGGFDVLTVKNPVKLVFWDLETGKITRTAPMPHRVDSVAFSPDGKWLATTAGEKEIGLLSVGGGAN